MTETKDIRGGWTSASNAQADRLCAGRHGAQKGIPDTRSKDADHGTLIHAALSGDDAVLKKLTPDQRDMYDSHREVEKGVIARVWADEKPDGNNTRVWRHERYWCKVPAHDGDKVGLFQHSGEADFVMKRGRKILIQDYKSLRGDTPASPRNEQLRDHAVMVWRCFQDEVNEIHVAINQPLVTWTPEICKYTKPELEQAEREMWDRVRKSNDPNARRVAGDVQCKFCKAKAKCAEYAKWSSALVPEFAGPNPFLTAMQGWSVEQRVQVAEHLPRLKKLLSETEDFLKASLSTDPESVPGFYLKDGQTREVVNDPNTLHGRFLAAGGTTDQFLQCIAITKGKLEEQVRAVSGVKGKALKAKLDELLAGIVDVKQNEPSLARKKE